MQIEITFFTANQIKTKRKYEKNEKICLDSLGTIHHTLYTCYSSLLITAMIKSGSIPVTSLPLSVIQFCFNGNFKRIYLVPCVLVVEILWLTCVKHFLTEGSRSDSIISSYFGRYALVIETMNFATSANQFSVYTENH